MNWVLKKIINSRQVHIMIILLLLFLLIHCRNVSGKLEAVVWENRVKNRVRTGKNHKLKAVTYCDYVVIAIIVDPLQKCAGKIRCCGQRKEGKNQGMNWEKSLT